MTNPSYLLDETSVAARASEVPNASFANGMNAGASNAPGVGINAGVANIAGTDEQFTLLDQAGAARTPQDSQQIGTTAVPVKIGTNHADGTGVTTDTGDATLVSLAAGWSAV